MNLTLSLRGPDLYELGRALLGKGWLPPERPLRLNCDDRPLASRDNWLEHFGPKTRSELLALWQDDSFFLLGKAAQIVKLDRRLLDLDVAHLVRELATLPFETAVLAPRRFYGHKGPRPEGWRHGRGLTGAHYQAGWGLALRGAGHLHLVSRRWITHGGPWRVLRGANDTTVFQFHDLGPIDPQVVWSQAKPCVERLTYQPELDTGGLVDSFSAVYAPAGAKYDAAAKRLWVVAGSRTISGREMREAAEDRFNARIKPNKWRALDTIAYVFSSEALARTHLHDLWLRELECWYETGGRRVRLDESYKPPPPAPPAWIAELEALEKHDSDPSTHLPTERPPTASPPPPVDAVLHGRG